MTTLLFKCIKFHKHDYNTDDTSSATKLILKDRYYHVMMSTQGDEKHVVTKTERTKKALV